MNNNNFLDAVNILSLILAIENLQENREQSQHNDVQVANNKQAEFLLQEINKRFDKQNEILEEQNLLLDKIITMLEKN